MQEYNPFEGEFVIKEKEIPLDGPHPNLTFVGISTASDLYSFYVENQDALLVDEVSILEFIMQDSYKPEKVVEMCGKLFRQVFLLSVGPISSVVEVISNLFG